MRNLRPLQSVLQAVIGTLVLALVVRTWLVMGLVAPVTVVGNSMAPTLRGEHLRVECPECEAAFSLGTEFSSGVEEVSCPVCGKHDLSLKQLPIHAGDGLWIDRQAVTASTPQRGDLVVLRNPEDGSQLCVKRVWGLPGETVQLRHGELLVDGQPVRKSLEQQRTMRRLVHRDNQHRQHWRPDSPGSCNWQQDCWKLEARASQRTEWLRYFHPGDQPITDDLAYNLGLTRRLNLVRDLMLSVELHANGHGTLHLRLDDGHATCQVSIDLRQRKIVASIDGTQIHGSSLPAHLVEKLQEAGAILELSNFDHQSLLAFDGRVLFSTSFFATDNPPKCVSSPFALGVHGLEVELRQLTVYRDAYFTSQAVGLPPARSLAIELGPGGFFLLGDNSPVSVDSRHWGAVPARLLVGRPVGVR